MASLIAFGEVLIDWIPLQTQAFGELEIPVKGQFPGGAPANVAVALARLGQDAKFVGAVGEDDAGIFLRKCLQQFKVDTQHLLTDADHPTPMAFVSLDEHGERSFSFSRNNSADLHFSADYFTSELFNGEGIFHICSNTLTDERIFETTLTGLHQARKCGYINSFDVNLRLPLWADTSALVSRVMDCISHCDIIKLSLEEVEYLAAERSSTEFIQDLLKLGPSIILVTDGGNPVQLFSKQLQLQQATPKVNVVDTTGAGDAFMGGWLYGLLAQAITSRHALQLTLNEPEQLQQAMLTAVTCGGYAVSTQGAWTALPTVADMPSNLRQA
ncbi:carbohydrate kinase family protein [Motilimonas pumila]|uniref:Carbohydrate kinase n=1 Tax=Motilimonas pumila TaxID=2303987 RepID=A0A418YHD7_9GAMM|nr:carbohydrate kinase [Motilimonas pumila]RJG49512.1 carbohydrate kinase [Motilimonas pumila]